MPEQGGELITKEKENMNTGHMSDFPTQETSVPALPLHSKGHPAKGRVFHGF